MGAAGMKIDKQAVKDHFNQKIIAVDHLDKEMWELISLRSLPLVNKPVAVIQALFNLIFPGLGTIIAACAASDG